MWWQVVFQMSLVTFARSMHIMHDPLIAISMTGVSCINYSHERFARMFNEGWRSSNPLIRQVITKRSSAQPVFNIPPAPPRRMNTINIIDNLIPRGDYLVKEHAKLVHDINSLRHVVLINPIAEENRDYDDSIFQEIIEASPTSTPGPQSARPFESSTPPYITTTKAGSIPIILLGGASQRHVIKSQPINFAKPTVSLVGTTISPLIKHPYPFVMHRKPVKICVTAIPPILTPQPPTKTLWERLLDYFIPRRRFIH